MGVPTLTFAGDTMLARQGAGLLQTAGLDEWVARSEKEYVLKACTLSADLPRLAILRHTLRSIVPVPRFVIRSVLPAILKRTGVP